MPELDQKTIDGLSPGVRDLVVWLNSHGFETTDSGDGSNHAAGMDGAVEFPLISVVTKPATMPADAGRLMRAMIARGVQFGPGPNDPSIEGVFWPYNSTAMLILTNVTSEAAGL